MMRSTLWTDVVCFLYLANPSRFGRAVFCAGRTGPYEIKVALWVYRIVPLPYICAYVRRHIAVQRRRLPAALTNTRPTEPVPANRSSNLHFYLLAGRPLPADGTCPRAGRP
jgi:hypothetical protein